ncbi:MAG: hypothetical protein O3C28_19380, partial [Proteobacteria bacterium]|nr:hypothetical protein [Pseudomonadota bacterium]
PSDSYPIGNTAPPPDSYHVGIDCALTPAIPVIKDINMVLTSIKAIASRKQWLFGLVAACLLVFQTSKLVHGLDLAAHAVDPDCEICDLFVSSNDDVDAIPAGSVEVIFSPAIALSASFEIAVGGSRCNPSQIRAPPYFS